MRAVSNCKACSFRECLLNDSVPVSGIGNIRAPILVVNLRSTLESHVVEKPLGTRNSILLKKIIEAAGLTDNDFYLTSVVKCAGPIKPAKTFKANMLICKQEHLDVEVAFINPKVIVCLGTNSASVCSGYKANVMQTYSMEELYRHGAAYFDHAVDTFKKAKEYVKIT